MAHWQRLDWIETLTRKLLLMAQPPALLFLTSPLWHDLTPHTLWQRQRCSQLNGTRNAGKMDPLLMQQTGAHHIRDTWMAVEAQIDRVCKHYGQACLSMRRALGPSANAGRPGFGLAEIAADCLHPITGSLGTEYVTDMLVEWRHCLEPIDGCLIIACGDSCDCILSANEMVQIDAHHAKHAEIIARETEAFWKQVEAEQEQLAWFRRAKMQGGCKDCDQ